MGSGVHRNVKRFRGGLVFKAHRLVYHSTLGLRVIKKKKKIGRLPADIATGSGFGVQGKVCVGCWMLGVGCFAFGTCRVWGVECRSRGATSRQVQGVGFMVCSAKRVQLPL